MPNQSTSPASVAFHDSPFSAPLRVLALALAHGVGRPLLWSIDRLGYSERVWARIGEKIRADVVGGCDFGDYQPTSSDVVVCTYPKCGTNWAMQITHQIATRAKGEFAHIHDVVPWPDWAKQEMILPLSDEEVLNASPTGLRVIKTHLDWTSVPYTEAARYLCIVRDPKDAFVSNYHFIRDVFFGPLMPPVRIWHRLFCSPAFPFDWSEHLHSYWQDRAKPNLLILTFDEMKADLEGSVRRIAGFMGVELSESEFATVCEKSSFAYMKGIGDRFDPPAMTPLSSPNRQMIRRGASGGSSEILSKDQQTAIDEYCQAELKRLGSDFPYRDTWGKR